MRGGSVEPCGATRRMNQISRRAPAAYRVDYGAIQAFLTKVTRIQPRKVLSASNRVVIRSYTIPRA